MTKAILFLIWSLRILLGLGFLMASLGKLSRSEVVIQMFQEWGYFQHFYIIIGILELSLAILLIIPKTSVYAILGLIVIMIGALITHLLHDPPLEMLRPIVFMVLLLVLFYLQKGKRQLLSSHKLVS